MGMVKIFTPSDSFIFWAMGHPKLMAMHQDVTVLIDARFFQTRDATEDPLFKEMLAWCEAQFDDVTIAYTARRLMVDQDGDEYFQNLKHNHPTIFFQHPETAVAFKLTYINNILDLYDPTLPVLG